MGKNKFRDKTKKIQQPEEPVKQQYKGLKKFYVDNYKKLLVIPFVILALALLQIGVQYATTGDFMHKGVSLKGGVTITVPERPANFMTLEEKLKADLPGADISVRELASGLIIEADITDNVNGFVSILEKELNMNQDKFAIEVIGSSLSNDFYEQTLIAIGIAFVFMSIIVFLYFRFFVPSIAVITAAFADMVVTLAVMNVLGIKISTAGIAAFLMLIGYSVDTDMLLTIKMFKRKEGTHIDRMFSAIKTGLMMTATALAAVAIGLIFSKSEVLTQIMTILFIGLVVDLWSTWIQNVGLLRLYIERKK